MNVIGIDYQQTLSMICLREGQGTAAKLRSIGDGVRHLIPNVVLGEELWGSHALLEASSDNMSQGDPAREGPWLDEPGALTFWRGIAKRLHSYLGMVSPIQENGYQVVVGLNAIDSDAAVKNVEQLCHATSLKEVTCIPASDALLCRWLGEQRASDMSESVVVTVVISDTTTLVAAYCIQRDTDRRLHLLKSRGPVIHLPLGHSAWMFRMLEYIHARFSEPPPPGDKLAIRDAVIEFVTNLSNGKADQAVEWIGLLRERMYAPRALTRQDCATWPEALHFSQALPATIHDALASISDRSQPDQILVGGIGTLWPFVVDAATRLGPVWRSDTPQEDVARGAAWWPEFQMHFDEPTLSIGTKPIAAEQPLTTLFQEVLLDWPETESRSNIVIEQSDWSETLPAFEELSEEEEIETIEIPEETGEKDKLLPPWKRKRPTDF